jgi:hypothetical protein
LAEAADESSIRTELYLERYTLPADPWFWLRRSVHGRWTTNSFRSSRLISGHEEARSGLDALTVLNAFHADSDQGESWA